MDKIREINFIDAEFTGLNPFKHELVEVGLIKVKQELLPDGTYAFEELEEFELKLKPERLEDANPESLEIFGYSEERWADAYSQYDGLLYLRERITQVDDDDPTTNWAIIGGHNVHNDVIFILTSFNRHGIEHKMNKYIVDTHSMASGLLFGRNDMKSLSLSSLCEFFEVKNENAHTALSDARATFEVYKKMLAYAANPNRFAD